MPIPLPKLDDRSYADLIAEAQAQISAHHPAWSDHNPSDAGIVLLEDRNGPLPRGPNAR